MQYILRPTNNDILHYAKGSESKSHNYISRVLKNGKWVYIYAKNRLRGNKVTNKNGNKKGYQYNPTIKTETVVDRSTGEKTSYRTEPGFTKQYLYDVENTNTRRDPILSANGNALGRTVTNQSVYNDRYDHRTGNIIGDNQYSPKNRAVNTASRGTAYEPPQSSKAANSRHYTPAQSSKAASSRHYTPTTKRTVTNRTSSAETQYAPWGKTVKVKKKTVTNKTGKQYTPGQLKRDKEKQKNKGKIVWRNGGAGSHSF